jgi:O-antigen/teichoic acid export membrane protein
MPDREEPPGHSRDDILDTPAAGPAAVRGGALRVGGYLIGVLASTLSAALLFRHLGVADTGRYVTALSLVAIVGTVSDFGLTGVGLRELASRPPSQRWALARDLLGLRITLTVVGGIAAIGIAWIAYSPEMAAGVAIANVGLLLLVTQDNFAIPMTIWLRLGWVAALELMRQLLTVLLTVVLVLLGARVLPFLGMSIPVGVVVLAVTVVLVRGTRKLAPTFSWQRWRTFTAAMLPYSLAVAAGALYLRVGVFIVSGLSNATQLGYFSASFRIIEVLTLVPGLLVGSAFPIFVRAAQDSHDRLGYALGRVFDVSLIVGVWVAVAIAVGAPLAIRVIGGAHFKPAAPILALQGVALGALFVSAVWSFGLLSLGVYRQILVVNLSLLVVNAAIVAVLVPLDGARGAAIGTAVAEVMSAFVQAFVVIHGRPQLRPSLRILPRVTLAAAAGLTPLLLSGAPTIARLVLSILLFGAVLLFTRALPRELLDLLPRARPSQSS